eukprot:6112487-Pyramimonas_sp.AAC.1
MRNATKCQSLRCHSLRSDEMLGNTPMGMKHQGLGHIWRTSQGTRGTNILFWQLCTTSWPAAQLNGQCEHGSSSL